MKLLNQTKNQEVSAVVIEATSFMDRLVGLMAQSSLDEKSTMYFPKCNNIHTCFMRFAIDVVFVDQKLKVTAVHENVRPFRLRVQMKAYSAFEFTAGVARATGITVGDQLNVVD